MNEAEEIKSELNSRKKKMREALENFLKEDSEAAKKYRQQTLETLIYGNAQKGMVTLFLNTEEEEGSYTTITDSALTEYHIMKEAIADMAEILEHLGIATFFIGDLVRVKGKHFVVELVPVPCESERESITDKASRELWAK